MSSKLTIKDLTRPALRALSVSHWELTKATQQKQQRVGSWLYGKYQAITYQQPLFHTLNLYYRPSQQVLAKSWCAKFSQLGHTFNLQLSLPDAPVQILYRPLCTGCGDHCLTFRYLAAPVTPET